MMKLTTAQQDRACGAILGTATGDALGAGYEFDAVRPGPDGPEMIGGGLGGFAQGEWTDDTSMMYAVLAPMASGLDVRSGAGLDIVAAEFKRWYDARPADIGVQNSQVLGSASATADSMTAVARSLHERTGRTAGNPVRAHTKSPRTSSRGRGAPGSFLREGREVAQCWVSERPDN